MVFNCFSLHENQEKCNNFCKNCKGSHFSSGKKFPVYLDEIKILKVKEFHNSNYLDAKSLVNNNKVCNEQHYVKKLI